MFNSQHGNLSTLSDLAEDFELEHGVAISKQGLDERFNAQAVRFLTHVLSGMFSSSFQKKGLVDQTAVFTSCCIRDSSRFGLPDAYASVYKGQGGATGTVSMISIQYEVDLLSGNQIDLQLTSGCRNDQQDTLESSVNIEENSLLIRDLGYITSSYLKSVIGQKAYFLNRLPSQMMAYDIHKNHTKVDFDKLYKKMKRHGLPYMELNVHAGKKAQIPCRLIVYLNDDKTTRHRLKRTAKNTKSIGCTVSKEQKTRAKLSIYITNVDREIIRPENVKAVYSLRWQIELVFKTWKSLCNIDKIKKVKIHRFECMLLAGLIWILAHWKVFQLINNWFDEYIVNKTCSIWKFFKHSIMNYKALRRMIFGCQSVDPWLEKLINMAEKKFYRESKRGQMPYLKALDLLRFP